MKRFLKGFTYAFNGWVYVFKTQLNFKFHCLAGVLVIALGLYVDLSVEEWIWITAAIALVMVVELINTALEVLVDLVSPQIQAKAGRVKDIAAGSVLMAALMALVIGLFIFVPKFL